MTPVDTLQKSSLLERSKAVRTFPLFPLPQIELDLTSIKNYNWNNILGHIMIELELD